MDQAAPKERRRLGAWSTPLPLVEHVLDRVLADRDPTTLRVLDPACGDGRFLEAAGRRGVRLLVGMDVDPSAVAVARQRAPGADIRLGDALTAAWDGRFDVVVGNPPFLSQLSSITSRGGRHALGGGAYADTAAVFLALAVELARPRGGRVGFVLPTSVLATRDAGLIRAAIMRAAALTGVWWAGGDRLFDATIDTVALTFERDAPRGRVERWVGARMAPAPALAAMTPAAPTWGHLLADLAGVPPVEHALVSGRLGDVATATAGFRRHFYGLAPHLVDSVDAAGPRGRQRRRGLMPVVTAGLLDPGRCAWGERPARIAGRVWAAPMVDLDALAAADTTLRAWAAARARPKVLVATQTRVVEAAVDEHGTWLPGVPVISVEPNDVADVWRVGAVLTSPVASAWAATTAFGAGLSPGAVKLSAGQILDVPWPMGDLGDAADLLRAGDASACGAATMAAYGLTGDDPVMAWWLTLSERSGLRRRRP